MPLRPRPRRPGRAGWKCAPMPDRAVRTNRRHPYRRPVHLIAVAADDAAVPPSWLVLGAMEPVRIVPRDGALALVPAEDARRTLGRIDASGAALPVAGSAFTAGWAERADAVDGGCAFAQAELQVEAGHGGRCGPVACAAAALAVGGAVPRSARGRRGRPRPSPRRWRTSRRSRSRPCRPAASAASPATWPSSSGPRSAVPRRHRCWPSRRRCMPATVNSPCATVRSRWPGWAN